MTRPETDALRPLPTLTLPSLMRVLRVAGSVLTRVTCTDLVIVLPCGSSAMTVIVCGPEGELLRALPLQRDVLPEATSAPVKLRILLPSAWNVIRATLLASLATALMVSTCTYCSLVAGVLMVRDGGVEVAARPGELVAARGHRLERVP